MKKSRKPSASVVRRVLQVQAIYLEHKQEDLPNVYIYRKYIEPVYFISERTFYRYLARNAKKEFTQLQQELQNENQELHPA